MKRHNPMPRLLDIKSSHEIMLHHKSNFITCIDDLIKPSIGRIFATNDALDAFLQNLTRRLPHVTVRAFHSTDLPFSCFFAVYVRMRSCFTCRLADLLLLLIKNSSSCATALVILSHFTLTLTLTQSCFPSRLLLLMSINPLLSPCFSDQQRILRSPVTKIFKILLLFICLAIMNFRVHALRFHEAILCFLRRSLAPGSCLRNSSQSPRFACRFLGKIVERMSIPAAGERSVKYFEEAKQMRMG
jgi:hypothetical protein